MNVPPPDAEPRPGSGPATPPAPSPPAPRRRGWWPRSPVVPAAALLLALLLAVNAVAVWGIFSARQGAREEAVRGLGLTTAAQGRALEADLASLAGDLQFLASSPVLARAPAAMASGDPMVARWARLGAEGNLLLFVESRDEVERLLLRGPDGEVLVAVGRRQGAPVVLPPADRPSPPQASPPGADDRKPVRGFWPLAGNGRGPADGAGLEAWVLPATLLAERRAEAPGSARLVPVVLPGDPVARDHTNGEGLPGDRSETGADGSELADAGGGDAYSVTFDDEGRAHVSTLVVAESWRPPRGWMLIRAADGAELVGDLDLVAGRYSTTLLVNLVIVSLTAVLGALAFREVRRSSRLAAENAQQARVRELERRVLHQERLAGVGRLAAGMAHEINNPLAGMTNYLRLLEDDLERGDVAAARGSAERVESGLHRIAAITRQVLDYSDPGRAPKRPVDLAAEVAATVTFVRGSGGCPGVELRQVEWSQGEPAEGLWVRGNATTLGQLFLNLVLNACQATAEGGTEGGAGGRGAGERAVDEKVAAGRAVVEVVLAAAGDRARVEVRDRGPGLPEEGRSRLFEPFFSTRGSTGLGLAVCHGVVQDHGGEIRAEARPGGGAVFTVELPRIPPPRENSATEPAGEDEG